MGRFEEQIKQAEQQFVSRRIEEWRKKEASKIAHSKGIPINQANQKAEALTPPNLAPRGWVEVEYATGFIVMDIDGFLSLPKTQRTKILKLGGKNI